MAHISFSVCRNVEEDSQDWLSHSGPSLLGFA